MLKLEGRRVYLACGATDMRKSINGLMAVVEGSFKLDPWSGAVFGSVKINAQIGLQSLKE